MKTTADQPAAAPTSLEPATGPAAAFTLLELVVILAVLMLLAVMVLPALGRSGLNSRAFQCLNNSRQLCAAWRMYADDNQDRLVFASTSGSAGRAGGSVPIDTLNPGDPNNYAWTGAHMDFQGVNRANWDPSYDLTLRPLWPYNKSLGIYKCPSDLSSVSFFGISKPRLISMSMNLYLGGFCGTDGGWPFADNFRIFLKTTDLVTPGPADTFVFIDGRADSINWGNFFVNMTGYPNQPARYSFLDLPGLLHDLAASVSFADGRAELHRWLDPRTTPPFQTDSSFVPPGFDAPSPNNPDVAWLQAHATRPK